MLPFHKPSGVAIKILRFFGPEQIVGIFLPQQMVGVHIRFDKNLSLECHINEISKKIASGISAIKRIRYFLPFEILHNVYNSLAQPHFDYCNVVWRNCSKNVSSKLQKLQNRAARVLTFSNYDCSTMIISKFKVVETCPSARS